MLKTMKHAIFAAAMAVASLLALAAPIDAATVTAQGYAGFALTYKGTAALGGSPTIQLPLPDVQNITNGTSDFQADLAFISDNRSISASSSENLDLAGVLTDSFGTTLTMVEVIGVYIEASCSNTNNVVVGAATSPVGLGFGGTTQTWAIQPCGRFFVTAPKAGWTVGAGSTDLLKVANSGSGTAVVYKVVILGRSS